MAKPDLTKEIERLARIVERMTVPIPAIPAIPPIIPTGDHDLLTKLDGKVDALKNDIQKLADGTSTTIGDHEARIRAIEKKTEDSSLVRKVVFGAVSLVLVAVFSALIYLVVK